MQICIERVGENAILMHFHAIISDIRSSGEPENILTTNYRFQQCGTMGIYLLRLYSFLDFSGRRITGISIPNSTYSSSNGTEIILFRNKSPS